MTVKHILRTCIQQYLPLLALKRRAQLDVHDLQGHHPMFNLDEAQTRRKIYAAHLYPDPDVVKVLRIFGSRRDIDA